MALSRTPLGNDVLEYDQTVESDLAKEGDLNLRHDPTTLYAVEVENGAVTVASVKVYDSDGDGWVGGTTLPDFILPCGISLEVNYFWPNGVAMAVGVSVAAAQEDGKDLTTDTDNATVTRVLTKN